MTKDLITLLDWDPEDLAGVFDLAEEMKARPRDFRALLDGRCVGLIFQKPSNRTRVSFEVGIHQLGGRGVYLGPDEIHLGKREAIEDIARTLSRYLDGIMARVFAHADIEGLARWADVPVINGLSDLCHPCQALADLFTMRERFGRLQGLRLAYVGDGNNVCHSLLAACAMTGVHMTAASPPGYEPDAEFLKRVEGRAVGGARLRIVASPSEAVAEADVVYTDVWTSMGQEEEAQTRRRAFEAYRVDAALTASARAGHIFMHCLPAHRGEEVTAEVIDGPHSVVFDQAENRLHVQKAVLAILMRDGKAGLSRDTAEGAVR